MSNQNKPRRQQQAIHHAANQPEQQILHQASFYQGIIPKSDELEHYERISPGFASRIIKLTEDEGNHRRSMERRVINNSVVGTYLGQLLGFVAVMTVCYLCYFAFDKGYPTAGASLGIAVLVGMASAFKLLGGDGKSTSKK